MDSNYTLQFGDFLSIILIFIAVIAFTSFFIMNTTGADSLTLRKDVKYQTSTSSDKSSEMPEKKTYSHTDFGYSKPHEMKVIHKDTNENISTNDQEESDSVHVETEKLKNIYAKLCNFQKKCNEVQGFYKGFIHELKNEMAASERECEELAKQLSNNFQDS